MRNEVTALFAVVVLSFSTSTVDALFLGDCKDTNLTSHWIFNKTDGTVRPQASSEDCVSVVESMLRPVTNGSATRLEPCQAGASAQVWTVIESNNSIVLRDHPSYCINVKDYGKTADSVVWMWTCNANDCHGNCDWRWQSNGQLVNGASGLCLVDLPPPPRTCDQAPWLQATSSATDRFPLMIAWKPSFQS